MSLVNDVLNEVNKRNNGSGAIPNPVIDDRNAVEDPQVIRQRNKRIKTISLSIMILPVLALLAWQYTTQTTIKHPASEQNSANKKISHITESQQTPKRLVLHPQNETTGNGKQATSHRHHQAKHASKHAVKHPQKKTPHTKKKIAGATTHLKQAANAKITVKKDGATTHLKKTANTKITVKKAGAAKTKIPSPLHQTQVKSKQASAEISASEHIIAANSLLKNKEQLLKIKEQVFEMKKLIAANKAALKHHDKALAHPKQVVHSTVKAVVHPAAPAAPAAPAILAAPAISATPARTSIPPQVVTKTQTLVSNNAKTHVMPVTQGYFSKTFIDDTSSRPVPSHPRVTALEKDVETNTIATVIAPTKETTSVQAVTKPVEKTKLVTKSAITAKTVTPKKIPATTAAKTEPVKITQAQKENARVEKLTAMLRTKPTNVEIRLALANTLLDLGHKQTAKQLLEEGLRLNSSSAVMAQLLARVYQKEANTTKAIEVLENTHPGFKGHENYFAYLAALYEESSQSEQAVKIYKHLVGLRPNNAIWWMGLGVSSESSGDVSQAKDAYVKALGLKHLNYKLQRFVTKRLAVLNEGESKEIANATTKNRRAV